MVSRHAVALVVCLFLAAPSALAKDGGAHGSYSTGTHGKAATSAHHDSPSKIARDPRQTNAFKHQHPCPSTRHLQAPAPAT